MPTLSDAASALGLCAEGAALSDAGDIAGAIDRYARAVDREPAELSLHLVLANAQLLDGRTLEARATLRRAAKAASRPDAASDFTLGKALVDAGAGADAVQCFRRVRAECPGDVAAAAALAAALRDAQRPDDAWIEVSAALRMTPDDPVALLTAALIRHDLSDFAGALEWCEKSLAARPGSDGARVTRGYLRHLTGDVAGGWSDFEARPLPRPATAARRWHGEPLAGMSILVMGEQGVGDQFQFLRFVRHVALQAAARVVVSVQPDAVPLLCASGYDAVSRDVTTETDWYVPLLSLPHRLGLDAAWAGCTVPYITVPAVRARTPADVKRVGVVWAGNPAHRNDAARSIPAGLLNALLHSHPAVTFVSMQHGAQGDDLPHLERQPRGDWLSTARHLSALDLLITVDTGIAHLAGALGVPTWILLPHVPDWRWRASGHTTSWYPSMRLFRQPSRGDWSRTLTNVSAALSTAALGG